MAALLPNPAGFAERMVRFHRIGLGTRGIIFESHYRIFAFDRDGALVITETSRIEGCSTDGASRIVQRITLTLIPNSSHRIQTNKQTKKKKSSSHTKRC